MLKVVVAFTVMILVDVVLDAIIVVIAVLVVVDAVKVLLVRVVDDSAMLVEELVAMVQGFVAVEGVAVDVLVVGSGLVVFEVLEIVAFVVTVGRVDVVITEAVGL